VPAVLTDWIDWVMVVPDYQGDRPGFNQYLDQREKRKEKREKRKEKREKKKKRKEEKKKKEKKKKRKEKREKRKEKREKREKLLLSNAEIDLVAGIGWPWLVWEQHILPCGNVPSWH
jgi:transposase